MVEYKENDSVKAIKICNGLRISVRKEVLDNIVTSKETTSKFKLMIKRIDRWWFSIYFGDIDDDKIGSNIEEYLN